MNKAELVKAVSEETQLTQKSVEDCLKAVLSTIENTLSKKKEDVVLTGFGTFKLVQRKSRKARNFKTGKEIIVPASKSVSFKAGKGLKGSVN